MNEMFPGFEKMKMLTVKKSAEYLGITEHGVYMAILKGKINATKMNGKYLISERMLDVYYKNKYDRRYTLKLSDDEFTVSEIAKKYGLSQSYVYRTMKKNGLDQYRKNNTHVIRKEDLPKLYKYSSR